MTCRRLIATTLFLTACSGGGASGFGGSGGKKTTDPTTKSVDHTGDTSGSDVAQTPGSASGPAEEEASVPLIVSGAYLTCADAELPAGNSAGKAVGCNLTDKKTNNPIAHKILLKDGAASSWKGTLAAADAAKGVKLDVTENKDPKSGEAQALFLFSGADADALKAASNATEVRLDLPLKEKVDGVDFFQSTIAGAVEGDGNKTTTKAPVDSGSISNDNPKLDPTGDQDGDGVLNGEDKCDNTPKGALVWTQAKVDKSGDPSLAKWIGCSGGEYNDGDDQDHDKVADVFDKCPATPLGETIVTTDKDPRRGCATEETP